MRIEIAYMKRMGDSAGFTLVELMISLVLLLFISLALMQTALVSIDSNTRNMLRDEGTQIAQQKLDQMRNVTYSDLKNIYNGTSGTVTRKLRSINQSYSVTNTVVEPSADVQALRMSVFVSWTWRSEVYNTTLSTVKGK